MTITVPQRVAIMVEWGKVCKDRGWKSGDKPFRLAKFSELVGRPLKSTDDVERLDECTKLMKGLRALLGVDVKAAREADDPTFNQARVLRHQIVTELVPCLELYEPDVPGFMATIMEGASRWNKTDRPERRMTMMDMNAAQLKMFQYTLSARLNSKRKAAGHTIHEMKTAAGVYCGCATFCRKNQVVMMPAAEEAVPAGDPDWNV